ncbi:FecR family protein [uncultured Bacteroides sp.]|uniref:FecR family protein n=1 Tax=uncultured Bacteroides sp. TaxID=162156 RepID=UPI0025DCA878|nr:FecR domain-containing protein [uncultured Bacteroides sp.]
MPIDNLEEMIVRQLSNNLTEQEAEELLNWYNTSEDNRKLYRDYCVLLKAQSVALDRRLFEKDNMRSWKRLKRRIQQRKISGFWLPVLRYASVAVVALLVGVGLHMLFYTTDTVTGGGMQVAVPAGSKSQIVLPDGTTVWLNSGSKLSYTEDFGKNSRTVYLDGEGFFDVTKNKKIGFEVYAGETRIRVLGTQFNMKAYSADERKRVTLLNGSLSVITNNTHSKETILVPNEQAVIMKGSSDIQVRRVEAENYVSWAEQQKETLTIIEPKVDKLLPQMHTPNQTFRNTLFFDEEPLSQIVKDLSRAYNVTIQLGCKEIATGIYYGDFRNEENLYEILDVITSSGEIYYEVRDNKIIINKNK